MGNCLESEESAIGGQQTYTANDAQEELNSLFINQSTPATEIIIRFACNNLIKSDKLSKSDPFIVFEEFTNHNWNEIGRTEVIVNNQSPKFVTTIKYMYKFEEVQKVKITVYDSDQDLPSNQLVLSNQDLVGHCETTISEIVTKGRNGLIKDLINSKINKPLGVVNIFSEEVSTVNNTMKFTAKIEDCPIKKKIFFTLFNLNSTNTRLNCYRSETKTGSPTYSFHEVSIDTIALCNSDEERPIVFLFSEYNSGGNHKDVFEVRTKLSEIRNNPKLPIIGLGNQSNQSCGYLTISIISIAPKISFLKYIFSGCEINFMVAIDFTGSNGHPKQSTSLHYIDPTGKMNQYEESIASVGGILEYYDRDKLFPTYLFGGNIDGKVEHCYPLNGNFSNPELPGISGILQWYHTALTNIQLYGPTLFSHVISTASQIAKQYDVPNIQRYLVLLILTDGVINDMDETKRLIVAASELPISIIILGVGSADFDDMEALDGDKVKLSSNGIFCKRDIVQFVSLNEIKSKHNNNISSLVLNEIPKQICDYMISRNKFPPS